MEMNTANHKRKEIVILLLADMRNARLIHGLNAVGLKTDTFYTCFTDLILYQMDFKNYTDEKLATWYKDLLYETINKDQMKYVYHERELAADLYQQLLMKKEELQGKNTQQDSFWIKIKKWLQ